METHEFYSQYANVPIGDRMEMITKDGSFVTLSMLYNNVKKLGDRIRQLENEQKEEIEYAEKIFNELHARTTKTH